MNDNWQIQTNCECAECKNGKINEINKMASNAKTFI